MYLARSATKGQGSFDRHHDHADTAAGDHRGAIGPAEVSVDDRHHCRFGEISGIIAPMAKQLPRVVDQEDACAERLFRDVNLLFSEKAGPPAGDGGGASG